MPTRGPHIVRTPTRRLAVAVFALAVCAAVLVTIAPPQGRAATPEVLLGRNRVGEFQGIRGANYIVWQENTRKNPNDYDLYARPIDGGKRFKVNAKGTSAANGAIESDLLIYQQFKGDRSDLQFFDMRTRSRESPPNGVNTSQWEYWPNMSGGRLLFGRLSGNGNRRIILFGLASGESQVLDKLRGRGSFLAPGQINGDWATWSRCPAGGRCDVIRYYIPDGTKEKVPNPGRQQYSASIDQDGTVYFARAKGQCGSGVRLMSYPLGGPEVREWRLPKGNDIGSTHVYVGVDGERTIYFDDYDCDRAAVSDVWQMVETGSGPTASPTPTVPPAGGGGTPPPPNPVLEVFKGGNGTGTVTSSPLGIDCGVACGASYLPGTTVTLTANADPGSTFAGWSLPGCPGTGTCVVTMNANTQVTATFNLAPVLLSVSKAGSGGGSVTSSPAGIDCGATCSFSYANGTEVTLTAAAAAGSVFGGWSGAGCSGTGNCVVTMDSAKSVTATFNLAPVLLSVSKAGSGGGSVTSNPAGIDCGATCSFSYANGTVVTLTASPGAASEFTGWSGGGCSGTGTCDVTMDSAKSVTATFDLKPVLTVEVTGTGTGSVTSSPAGIDCPGDCTEPYSSDTPVALTANPDGGSGSVFASWSGGGCDTELSNVCTVTMDISKTVTATFDPAPPPP